MFSVVLSCTIVSKYNLQFQRSNMCMDRTNLPIIHSFLCTVCWEHKKV